MLRLNMGAKGVALAGGLVGGSLLLAGCGTPANTTTSQNNSGTSTVAARPFSIDQTWDPFAGLTIMNPNSSTNAIMQWVTEPLAIESGRVVNGPYYPEVASKWSMKGNTLTVWLRKNEGWSNGKPVTAQDVKTSIELSYIES